MKHTTPIALAALLTACMGPESGDDLFERHEIALDGAEHPTVLTGFFLDGPVADLAAVDADRRLRVLSLTGEAWTTSLDAALDPAVTFVDVAGIDGRERLISYAPGRLAWFDPETAIERELVAVASDLAPSRAGEVAHVDVTRDLNGDGRDDLVVPGPDGFQVFVQLERGAFADPVTVGTPTDWSLTLAPYGYRHAPWSGGRVHELDYDLDGRSDLVYWSGDRFSVHFQDERGLFGPVGATFTTEVAFDSDDPASLAAPYGVRRRRMDHNPGGEIAGRVLHSFTDVNGDGVADLVVFSLVGGSLFEMDSTCEAHFGRRAGEGIAFPAEPDAAVRSSGIPYLVAEHDFDRDDQVDLLFLTTDVNVFSAIGMLVDSFVNGTVSMDLELHRMDAGDWPDRPDAHRAVKTVSFGRSGERATVFASVLVGDVDGDEHPDLLVQNRRRDLRIYPGVPDGDLIARRPLRVSVAMPDEEFTWLADLDANGRQDLVLHHAGGSGPNRVTLLVAR